MIKNVVVALGTTSLSLLLAGIEAQPYLDRFNYDSTITRSDGYTDYGPSDWGKISCDESSREDLDTCEAYIDKWNTGREWDIQRNYCRWCPKGNTNCGQHHQSPIDVKRNVGLGYWENDGVVGDNADPEANECIDLHWMKYEDSWCILENLIDADAFSVERHALRIAQPITVFDGTDGVHAADELKLECNKPGFGVRFGRLDYSKGFAQWWFLSHIDFHTPSEHYQEGKRYDGEIEIQHFYSVTAEEAGVNNEMGTVTIFMEVYDDAAPWRYLDKVICLWRRHEYNRRKECGLSPVGGNYPGCFPLPQARNLREEQPTKPKKKFQTVFDLIHLNNRQQQLGKNVSELPRLKMDPANWGPEDKTDQEWQEFISHQSKQFQEQERIWKETHKKFNNTYSHEAHEEFRRLIEGEDIEWFNYFPMLGVKTEYYFRYSGTQTIPPCYGTFDPGSRGQTNHWRVLKDPIRIHKRQLEEMQRLLRERIAPPDDPINPCQPETAAKVSADGTVDNARPLQESNTVNFLTFCECKDWPSKWPEDREWCKIEDPRERFYDHPYNFETNGF